MQNNTGGREDYGKGSIMNETSAETLSVVVEREIPAVREASTLVGLGGTITTVAAIELGLAAYDRDKIHHFRLTKAAGEDVFRTLATETVEERRHNPGLEPKRADVIVAGALELVTIMRTFGFDAVVVSESDILDGLVRGLTEQ
jgi:exopolyphosphatase / guanosine-5'-triphosphate,3'-diphosphate pyrophosphatase